MSYQIIAEETTSSPNNKKHLLVDATVQLPDGKQAVWQYIKSRDVVAIVALDSEQNIWLVRQWRPSRNDYVWELPAGGVEDKNPTEEQIFTNANRELQEEIGLKANTLKMLAKFTPTIHMQSNYYVVLATDLEPSKLPQDENENVEYKKVTIDEAFKLFTEGPNPSALNLVGLLSLKNK